MSATPGIDKFPIPGYPQPGERGDAAPDSLLADFRRMAKEKRAEQTLTLTLPAPRWQGRIRVRYGLLSLDQIQAFNDANPGAADIAQQLDLMARAVEAIEVRGNDGEWHVIEDALGPVTFDDRLARAFGFERPAGEDFVFSVRQVYEIMFDGNGIAISQHSNAVGEFMGVAQQVVAGSDLSTSGSPSSSGRPPSSG
jgi:hypothetical protein